MIQNGKIKSIKINQSGYECCIGLSIDTFRAIYCYVPLVTYKEPNISTNEIDVSNQITDEEFILRLNDEIRVNLKVVFVTDYQLIYDDCESIFEQPIQDSSHTTFIANVKAILDEYTLICSVKGLSENILVELENKISSLKIGNKIKFNGELSLNIL
jgi:hypothetical protein